MLYTRPQSQINTGFRVVQFNRYGGIDISSSNDVISNYNSPDMLNMIANNKGDLTTRYGIKGVKQLGGYIVDGFSYKDYAVVAYLADEYGTCDYYKLDGDNLTYIDSNIEPKSAFEYNNKLYILTESSFLVYDGSTMDNVTPYLPTAFINSPNTGGGTRLEEENRISLWQAQEFQKEAGNTEFTFYLDNLTDAKVYIRNATTGDWDLKTLTTDYTQNLATGVFTITATIPNSLDLDGNDAVRIEGKKDLGYTDSINKCTINAIYGGKANVSVWLSGNPDFPNFDFHSGVTRTGDTDPTYFPINEFDVIGFDDQSIIAYQNQNDELLIFKYNSDTKRESTWVRNTQIVDGEVRFYHQELNSNKGCIARDSVVLVNNSAWTLTKEGYGKIVPKQVLAENSIEIVSDYINYNRNTNFSNLKGLLEPVGTGYIDTTTGFVEIETIRSIDYRGKLYVAKEDQVWVCDYNNIQLDQTSGKYLPQWYLFDNMAVTCWFIINGILHFGCKDGYIKRFKTDDDALPYQDDQYENTDYPYEFSKLPEKFSFYYATKLTNLGTTQYTEDIEKATVAMQGYSNTDLTLWVRTNNNTDYEAKDTFSIRSLEYSTLTYSTMVYGGNKFPKAFHNKVKVKNAEYAQFKLGGTTGLPATITNFEINVIEGKEV